MKVFVVGWSEGTGENESVPTVQACRTSGRGAIAASSRVVYRRPATHAFSAPQFPAEQHYHLRWRQDLLERPNPVDPRRLLVESDEPLHASWYDDAQFALLVDRIHVLDLPVLILPTRLHNAQPVEPQVLVTAS